MDIKALVGISLALVTTAAGAYVYDLGKRAEQHEALTASAVAGDVELELKRVDLELKLLRTIQERRELTADEADRKTYLEDLRKVLIEEQRGNVGR